MRHATIPMIYTELLPIEKASQVNRAESIHHRWQHNTPVNRNDALHQ